MSDMRETIADIVKDGMCWMGCQKNAPVTADAILSALMSPQLEWYINYDHWEATTPHGTYEVGGYGLNSAWVKFPDGSNMWVKPFEMGKRLCDMDNAVSVLVAKEKADG